jgi:hypothetical protein
MLARMIGGPAERTYDHPVRRGQTTSDGGVT